MTNYVCLAQYSHDELGCLLVRLPFHLYIQKPFPCRKAVVCGTGKSCLTLTCFLKLRLTSTREELNHLHILLISHQWTVALVAAIIKEVCMTFSLPIIMAEAPSRALLSPSQLLQSSTLPPPLASKLTHVRLKANPPLPVLHR